MQTFPEAQDQVTGEYYALCQAYDGQLGQCEEPAIEGTEYCHDHQEWELKWLKTLRKRP